MSRFSGKCDLYDHIGGMGGWYDKDGNPVKFGQEGVHVYYSDEMQDFEAFKKATGGKIYQHKKIKVTEHNLDLVKEHCEWFDYVKEGKKIKSLTYWGKEYPTLNKLNKHGVYILVPIEFETILDIVPYYPYVPASICSSKGKQTVILSDASFVDEEFDEMLEYGFWHTGKGYYKRELQEHYLEICERYLLNDLEGRKAKVSLGEAEKVDDHYEISLPDSADYNHKPQFEFAEGAKAPSFWWNSPKLKDENTVIVSVQDCEHHMKELIDEGKVYVGYVKKLPESARYVD